MMSRIGSKDTKPEHAVRRLLHSMGYRFRLHRRDLPGSPDLVLPRWKTALFVHGCFWHGCRKCDKGRRRPKTNAAFWREKVKTNRRRDARVAKELLALGWQIITIWECEAKDTPSLRERLACAIEGGRRRDAI